MIGSLEPITFPEMTFRPLEGMAHRALFDANAKKQIKDFRDGIHHVTEYLLQQEAVSSHHETLRTFLGKFDLSVARWEEFFATLNKIPEYNGFTLDLLHIGMWDAYYRADPNAKLTPFGPVLTWLGGRLGGSPLAVLNGLVAQVAGPYHANLHKAQALAVAMYKHFLQFVDKNDIVGLKSDSEDPPIVQLHNGGGVTICKDLPIPTMIGLNAAKAKRLAGMSALPHEFGHDLSGTFQNSGLQQQIVNHVSGLDIPHRAFWLMWLEEALADAIGVAIIYEGEINGLANLFGDYYTNIIFKDEENNCHDEHPNRHTRVLLTIEFARRLGVTDEETLAGIEKRWRAYGEKKNKNPDVIFDDFKKVTYPIAEFEAGIPMIAEAILDTPYSAIKGKKVRDIFADFKNDVAEEMRLDIELKI